MVRLSHNLLILPAFLLLPSCTKIRHALHPPAPKPTLTSIPAPTEAIAESPVQTPLPQGDPITQLLVLNDNSCALYTSGQLKCWGSNQWQLLGTESPLPQRVPTQVLPPHSEVTRIGGSSYHLCAVKKSGSLICWGNNSRAQLGIQGEQQPLKSARPTSPPLSEPVLQVAAGDSFTCALLASGAVACWGANAAGQLGDGGPPPQVGYTADGSGNFISRWRPMPVKDLPAAAKAISSGDSHTCVLTTQGRVYCWGLGREGQLGTSRPITAGDMAGAKAPIEADGLRQPAEAIAAGREHTCALLVGGAVTCWGINQLGQLGTSSGASHPQMPTGLASGVTSLSAGGDTTCAIQQGKVLCWGAGGAGQLGNGSMAVARQPTPVKGIPSAAKQVVAGANHSCALLEDGSVYCWGSNGYGQVGDGANRDRLEATLVQGL